MEVNEEKPGSAKREADEVILHKSGRYLYDCRTWDENIGRSFESIGKLRCVHTGAKPEDEVRSCGRNNFACKLQCCL